MPDMQHAYRPRGLVDDEKHSIHVRPSPVEQDANRLRRVETLRRDRTPLPMLVQSENGPLEPIEPGRALVGRPFDDPEIELFQVSLGRPRDLNAESHAYGGADRTLAARA
jgi:hypothetical protein